MSYLLLTYLVLVQEYHTLTHGYRQTSYVCSKHSLKDAIATAKPGSSILLCDGVWEDLRIEVLTSGTEDKPISIGAENAGNVFIEGKSYIFLNGSYIKLHGFQWQNYGDPTPMQSYIGTGQYSRNCRISEMVFHKDNLAKFNDWTFNIGLMGIGHEVHNIAFLDKLGRGAQLIVLEGGNELDHALHHLYFSRGQLGYDLQGHQLNGGESLQIGAGTRGALPANDVTAHHLFFEYASGEAEIISLKGNRQTLSNVVMIGSEGALSVRSGTENEISNVYIDGRNKSNAAGIRIHGTAHIIRDATITGISDRWVGGLHIPSGSDGHERPSNITFEHVTITDASDSITFSSGPKSPSNISFRNVIATNKTADDRVLFVQVPNTSYQFSKSLLYGATNVKLPTGTIHANPKLLLSEDGLPYPSNNGPAAGLGSRLRELPVDKFETGPKTFSYGSQ